MPPRRTPPRRVTREVPRWRKAATSPQLRSSGPWWWRRDPAPNGWQQMSAGQAAKLARHPQLQAQLQLVAAGMEAVTAAAVHTATSTPLRVRRRSWRFRRHVQPFAWLAGLLAAGAGLHQAQSVFWTVIVSIVAPGAMYLAAGQQRKDSRPVFTSWAQKFTSAEALVTAVALPVMAVAGVRAAGVWVLLAGLPFIGLWVRRYGWRPVEAEVVKPVSPDSDRATFAALAGEQKWKAHLGDREDLDNGGRRYRVECDGVKTVMKKVLALPDNVAGAWHSTVSEVYAERDPRGVTSRGYLTILDGNSLQKGRLWDGSGMDKATGLVRTGRFADGKDSHDKWYEPRYGCYHDLDSGTTGSGKSERLNMKVFAALKTGWFVPVILDPQEGQSLPFWRDRCISASGIVQVERRVRGLHAAFLDRSAFLSTYRWSEDGVDYPGLPFFDYELLDRTLPMVLVILDEAHLVLKDGSKWQRQITADVVDMARLIRKAGGKMVLATQLPGLADLGGSQALRDMLRGGNVWSGRTANAVGQGMLGLVKDPSEIPRFFGDGSKTSGLGYTDGPDCRPDAPMRTDLVGKEHYRNPPVSPVLDDRFAEVMDRAMRDAVSPTSTVAPVEAVSPIPRPGSLKPPPEVEETDSGPDGKRCVDAVRQVLGDAAAPMSRGDVIKWVGDLSKMWGREKPWGIKMIQNVLRDLVAAGEAVQPDGKGNDYAKAPKGES